MITLTIIGKERLFSNKDGIKILRKLNPKNRFKIAKCKATGKRIIMLFEQGYYDGSNGNPNWICLHD
jgi:adenosine/AMP kinase